jgi:DNA-binding FadR family transcriptional regulator
MATAPLVEAPSRTGQMVDKLGARIASGAIASGAKLPSESELVAEFGVSRTVVREAISQLRARGLVTTQRGIGTFATARPARSVEFPVGRVDQATLAEVLALLELRISLETEASALAAQRRTAEQVARMEALLDTIGRSAKRGGDAADADFDFHLCVAESSGNHFFLDLMRHLGRSIIPRTRLDSAGAAKLDSAEYLREVNREHGDVLRAIANGDPDAARAAMRTHLVNSRERLRALRSEGADL